MSKDDIEDSDENDSDASDCDYDLPDSDLKLLEKQSGVNENRCQDLWNKQSGLCWLSNITASILNLIHHVP